MMSELTTRPGRMIEVPEEIERTIQEFDNSTEKLSARTIYPVLGAARVKLADKLATGNAWPDVVAFAFQREAETMSPWNTYFGANLSSILPDGTEQFSPDVRDLTPEVIDHWEHRANTIVHPVMRARYADLVWEFSRKVANRKPSVESARIAIDEYLDSVARDLSPEEHDNIAVLRRAGRLALLIGDADRTARARTMLLDAFDSAVANRTMWWKISNEFAESPKLGLSDSDKERVRLGWERLLSDFTAEGGEHFDPHRAETVGKHLIRFYNKSEARPEAVRVAQAVSKAFVAIAKAGSAMQATAWLDTAAEYANIAGDREAFKALKVEREAAIRKSRDEMQSFSHTQTLTREELEAFVNAIVDKNNWEQSLFNIAVQFLFSKERARRQVAKSAKTAVFMSFMSSEILADDHVSAVIGPSQEDQDGHLYREAGISQQLNARFLTWSLDGAVEAHSLSAEEITAFIFRSDLFQEFGIMREGIKAWLEEDFVKALFTLVPQVEAAFRNLARRLEESVTKPKPGAAGWEVSKNLGDFLAMDSVKDILGEDIIFHIRYVFSDGRGLNLRNLVAHGLVTSGYASWKICDLVVHSLLVLGTYEDVVKAAAQRTQRIKDSPVEDDDDDDDNGIDDDDDKA